MNKEKEITSSIITNDAFITNDEAKKESELIFLDLTDKSYNNVKTINGSMKIFKMKQFPSIKSLPSHFHSSWEYLYAIEIDNGKFLKIGYSKTPKHRLNTHNNSPKSILANRCNRVAIIGPIRDGINTEQIIHEYMGGFYAKEDFPSSNEIYSLDKVISFDNNKTKKSNNLFDLFCGTTNIQDIDNSGGIFGLIQTLYNWNSQYSCKYDQDLIIPKVKY